MESLFVVDTSSHNILRENRKAICYQFIVAIDVPEKIRPLHCIHNRGSRTHTSNINNSSYLIPSLCVIIITMHDCYTLALYCLLMRQCLLLCCTASPSVMLSISLMASLLFSGRSKVVVDRSLRIHNSFNTYREQSVSPLYPYSIIRL